MIGIFFQLAASWLLVWLVERRNLTVLGIQPTPPRLLHFGLFFFVATVFSGSGFLFKMWLADQRWQLNPAISNQLIAAGIWFNIKSVLFEELIFRGVLLYLLIKKIGAIKAVWISAITFGAFHWFTVGFNQPVQFVMIFLLTGAMGLVLGYAYAKTNSLYVPIGIHLGWNIVQQVVFSTGPLGPQLLVEVIPQPDVTVSYGSAFLIFVFPLGGVLAACTILIQIIRVR